MFLEGKRFRYILLAEENLEPRSSIYKVDTKVRTTTVFSICFFASVSHKQKLRNQLTASNVICKTLAMSLRRVQAFHPSAS